MTLPVFGFSSSFNYDKEKIEWGAAIYINDESKTPGWFVYFAIPNIDDRRLELREEENQINRLLVVSERDRRLDDGELHFEWKGKKYSLGSDELNYNLLQAETSNFIKNANAEFDGLEGRHFRKLRLAIVPQIDGSVLYIGAMLERDTAIRCVWKMGLTGEIFAVAYQTVNKMRGYRYNKNFSDYNVLFDKSPDY